MVLESAQELELILVILQVSVGLEMALVILQVTLGLEMALVSVSSQLSMYHLVLVLLLVMGLSQVLVKMVLDLVTIL